MKWVDANPPTARDWEYRYKAARAMYIERHPRLTEEAFDVLVDARIDRATQMAMQVGGVAGPEPGADTSGGVRSQSDD